jgi:hypothetical protein
METTTTKHDLKEAATRLVTALKDDRIDEAEAMYDVLSEVMPEADLLTFRVFLLIQRGGAIKALQFINEQPEGTCPELKAICLNLISDPTWYSMAESLEDSPDPAVRKAMRQLLQH